MYEGKSKEGLTKRHADTCRQRHTLIKRMAGNVKKQSSVSFGRERERDRNDRREREMVKIERQRERQRQRQRERHIDRYRDRVKSRTCGKTWRQAENSWERV